MSDFRQAKLHGISKVGVLFLTLSFLTWCGYIAYWLTLLDKTENFLAAFASIWSTAMLASVAISPLVYIELFNAQARENIGGVLVGSIVILGCLVYDNLEEILSAAHGEIASQDMLLQLVSQFVVPFITVVAALTSCRPLAIIGAILCIPAAIYDVQTSQMLNEIFDLQGTEVENTFYSIALGAVILQDIGLFFGLLGIRKVGR